MLSEAQIKQAWEEWLAADMRAHYFADLCGTYNRRHRQATWATLILSSSAAAVLLAKAAWMPTLAVPVFALAAAGVSLYSLVVQNPKMAADCADLHFRWNKLATEYQDVWNNVYADDAAERLARLNERRADASKAGAHFNEDEKRMLKWFQSVVQNRLPRAA